ncbi:hypothetical protein M595_5039 [Lyngbya aestuarii BL J]|uniref:Uncharacterized protein n=1 Tax=Lyngbya aestuarii BL J TaxID=1348334 RepID=U7QAZ8_9CYAN|nr:hypothetical protein M595_5039 [Lyngbya aestuarii BL J]
MENKAKYTVSCFIDKFICTFPMDTSSPQAKNLLESLLKVGN